jgi:hypothetical protein
MWIKMGQKLPDSHKYVLFDEATKFSKVHKNDSSLALFDKILLEFVSPLAHEVLGIIKDILGFRQCSLCGLWAAAGEWCLVCMAFNWKRLHTLTMR